MAKLCGCDRFWKIKKKKTLDDPTPWSNPPPLCTLSAGRSAVTPVYHPHLGPLAHSSISCVRDGLGRWDSSARSEEQPSPYYFGLAPCYYFQLSLCSLSLSLALAAVHYLSPIRLALSQHLGGNVLYCRKLLEEENLNLILDFQPQTVFVIYTPPPPPIRQNKNLISPEMMAK